MIDWSGKLVTVGGRPAILMPQDPWQKAVGNTKRRAVVCNYQNPKSQHERESTTTYLYDDQGKCRGDGDPSDYDLANA
jgi:hypothetical protein